jgi:AcrR family transcriptional regulator
MQTTKDRILSAVVSYIKEGLTDQISLAKIASDADIGKSTVYEHFKSKEEMIEETYRYLLSQYESILLKDISDMTFKWAFIEQLEKNLIVMEDARTIMDMLMNHHADQFYKFGKSLEPRVLELQNKIANRFESIMKLGVIEGVIAPRIPKPYDRYVIQAIMTGLMFQYVNQKMEIERNQLLELIYHEVIDRIKR